MLFNSYGFLFLFGPVVYALYWRMRTLDQRKWVSVLASYVFYGVWSWKFAALMLATTSVDYFTAKRLEDSKDLHARRVWLALSMTVNLGVLAAFKYYDFFAGALNDILPGRWLPALHVVLPIGISFYTFESMSYTIDVYRRHTSALRRFLDYAHFVTMFPRLVAGPIVRYTEMATQLASAPARLGSARIAEAFHFFTIGIAKKVLIADVLARRLVDPLFATPHALTASSAWTAAAAYTAQLYFDFSGYSDMAVGLALLLGFRLPRNFNRPYSSTNPSEFWRRWHISLSTWLRDYLYIPLGGNRGTRLFMIRNLFLTMLLGGLWHGANWTFVVWGAFHGVLLGLYNGLVAPRVKDGWSVPLPRFVSVGLMLVLVMLGWVVFRAPNITEAWQIYRAMAGAEGLGLRWLLARPYVLVVPGALALSIMLDTYELPVPSRVGWAVAEGLLLVSCVMQLSVPSPFLYFQF